MNTENTLFTHILIPLDGSHLSEVALPIALEIATRFTSQITLLRVAQPLNLPKLTSEFTELITTLQTESSQEAITYLQTCQNTLAQQGYQVNYRVIKGESITEAILQTADNLAVDLIVMSTHGRGGVQRWVYGSVADKVLRHANIPILLIRPVENPSPLTLPAIEDLETIRSHENPPDSE